MTRRKRLKDAEKFGLQYYSIPVHKTPVPDNSVWMTEQAITEGLKAISGVKSILSFETESDSGLPLGTVIIVLDVSWFRRKAVRRRVQEEIDLHFPIALSYNVSL